MDDLEEQQTNEEQVEWGPADSLAWPDAEPKQAAFLTALVIAAGQHGKAAKAARISRATHYRWLDHDEVYRGLYKRAMDQVTVVLEDAARRRAVDGIKKGIYFQGNRVATEVVYSDGLMMFLLRGAAPEKYRERVEHGGEVNMKHRFEGSLADLLATYRQLVAAEAE